MIHIKQRTGTWIKELVVKREKNWIDMVFYPFVLVVFMLAVSLDLGDGPALSHRVARAAVYIFTPWDGNLSMFVVGILSITSGVISWVLLVKRGAIRGLTTGLVGIWIMTLVLSIYESYIPRSVLPFLIPGLTLLSLLNSLMAPKTRSWRDNPAALELKNLLDSESS